MSDMFEEEVITRHCEVSCSTPGCPVEGQVFGIDLPVNYPTGIVCGRCGNAIPIPPAE